MAYANQPKDLEAKQKRISDTLEHVQPDYPPVLFLNSTWGFSYSDTKISDVLDDRDKMCDGLTDCLKDIYIDVAAAATCIVPFNMFNVLKPEEPQYIISEDGYTVQHIERTPMLDDEYPQLIDNAEKYIENIILPRRYPVFNLPYPQNYEALKAGYNAHIDFLNNMIYSGAKENAKYGLPALFGAVGVMPMDYIFDFLRGFKGISLDMRRRPDELTEGAHGLLEYCKNTYLAAAAPGSVLFFPLHVPAFLGPKQFDKFYYPTFKAMSDFAFNEKGVKLFIALEGDWTPHMEHLTEFKKKSFICHFEKADIIDAKKKFGEYITLAGGMPCATLRYKTKEECIDRTKLLLDTCAVGGGYFFSTEKTLCTAGDIDAEKFNACTDYMRNL